MVLKLTTTLDPHFLQFIEGKKEALYKICILISGAFLFKNLFLYLAQFFLAPIRNGMIAKLRNDVYKKMLRLPISFFNNEKKGDLMVATRDIILVDDNLFTKK